MTEFSSTSSIFLLPHRADSNLLQHHMAETVDAFLKWARHETNHQVDFPGVTKIRSLKDRKNFICDKLRENGQFQHLLDMIPSVDLKKISKWKADFVPNQLGSYIQEYKRKRNMKKTGSDAIGNKLADEESEVPKLPAEGTEVHQARHNITTLLDAESALNDVLQFLKESGGETSEVHHKLQPQVFHIQGILSAIKAICCLQSCDACRKRTRECLTDLTELESEGNSWVDGCFK